MSFADKVSAAIASAAHATANPVFQKYDRVLDELEQGLQQQGVLAKIARSANSRTLYLTLAPLYRPAQRSIMLRFDVEGDHLTFTGTTTRVLTSPEQLELELLAFVSLPAFVETLEILRARAKEPVDASLGCKAAGSAALREVYVTVTSEDQRRLYETTVGVSTEVDVTLAGYPGNAPFDPNTPYDTFDSAGVVLDVERVITIAGGALRIEGKRVEQFPHIRK